MVLLKVEMNISLSFFENQFSYLTFFLIKVVGFWSYFQLFPLMESNFALFYHILHTHNLREKNYIAKISIYWRRNNGHLSRGDLGAAESLDDDIVSVEPDDDHRHDRTGSKNRSQTPVEAACCKYKGF